MSSDEGEPSRTPVVIYIAGSGRSGSTLVERAIGAVGGFVNIGEALDLYRGALDRDELCGCGSSLHQCELWGGVIHKVDVLADDAQVARMTRLQSELIRQRRLPRMLLPLLRRGQFADGLREYAAGYGRVYATVAASTDSQYVVDASKWPVQALALSSGGIDVRVVHVIRDPRGVAYSHSKTQVVRPQTMNQTMFGRSALSSAVRWTATQTQVDGLRAAGVPTATLSYEAFVADPAGEVVAALADIDVVVPVGELAHLRPAHAKLPVSHGIAGNPSRFRIGAVDLRVDDAWRERLTPVQQKAVLTIAAPHLRRLRLARRTSTPAHPLKEPL